MIAKPFLKWAGGKSKLMPEINKYFNEPIVNYASVFLGSGADLFYVLEHHSKPKRVSVNDINQDLITCFECIKKDPDSIIQHLKNFQSEYYSKNYSDKENMYYFFRSEFNNYKEKNLKHLPYYMSAIFIFLNKTGYNGLQRFNKKGGYNVSWGKYEKPLIFDSENILAVSKAIRNVNFYSYDYVKFLNCFILEEDKFDIYLDPPYIPISKTSNFTGYSKHKFNFEEHEILKDLMLNLSRDNHNMVLTNSYCDITLQLYKDLNIHEINAARSINSKGNKRGKIKEIIVTNKI